MKKVIALLLTVVLAFSVAVPAFAVESEELPIVFVAGKGDRIVNEDGTRVYPLEDFPDGYLKQKVKEILPLFAKAVLTGEYEEWSDALADAVEPYYAPIALDNDGNPQNGSHTEWYWNENTLVRKTSGFALQDYQFRYDWRIDPLVIADQLDDYINAVLKVTGAKKVKIIGRCYGGSILLAYLSKYGNEKIDTSLFYVASALGAEESSKFFSGDIYFDADAINRYAIDNIETEEDPLMAFLVSLITMLTKTSSLDVPVELVNAFFQKYGDKFMPKMLRSTYGLFPGIWSTVDEESYEAAKAYIFTGCEDQYAGTIEKIDNYHYNVMLKAEDILQGLKDDGMNVSVITKYGRQSMCLFGDQNEDSDDLIAARKASFGATFADHEKMLPKSYIEERTVLGYGDYISPDNKVDASTALFPDSTWFVKDCGHTNWCVQIDELMMEICHFKGQMTVKDSERFTQFMLYDKATDTVSPLTAENDGSVKWSSSFFTSIIRFFASLLKLFKGLITGTVKVK